MLEKAQTEITHDACLGFFVTFIQRDEEERAGVLNNKVSISLTLSRTEGIALERIQYLNTEFRTEVKKGTLSTEPESIFSFTCIKSKLV